MWLEPGLNLPRLGLISRACIFLGASGGSLRLALHEGGWGMCKKRGWREGEKKNDFSSPLNPSGFDATRSFDTFSPSHSSSCPSLVLFRETYGAVKETPNICRSSFSAHHSFSVILFPPRFSPFFFPAGNKNTSRSLHLGLCTPFPRCS
jgi:hypothetical protein